MTRQALRGTIANTLSGTGGYQLVLQGAHVTFATNDAPEGGVSPVAIVLSAGQANTPLSRDMHDEQAYTYTVTHYVRVDTAGGSAAENTLDALRETAGTALRAVGCYVLGSDAAPAGAPLRLIDGVAYRVEMLRVTTQEYI